MEKKKLNHYDVFEVIDTFGIKKNRNCTVLKDWINANSSLTSIESTIIEQARQRLEIKWDEWNESQRRTVRIKNELHQPCPICCSNRCA